jgi:1-phosphatidylinositol phosphodiesterase
MVWIARGQGGNSYVQNALNGRTQSVPAIATHRGELWCLWSDPAGDLYYAVGDNNIFGARVAFPGRGIPVMAELAGMLHAIIVRDAGDMAHFIFEDSKQTWIYLNILDRPAGFFSKSTPAFVAFHNKLVLVFVHESTLLYSCWTLDPRSDTASWNPPQEVSGISKVRGVPALFVLDGILHVICSADDQNREILGFAYASVEDIWNSSGDVSEGKSAVGVSATSFGDSAFLAFQENGPENDSHQIFISEYRDGQWRAQESVAGQISANPPQLAVLNGRLNCIFNANDDEKSLRWYSRPLLDYSLSSWMENISDDTLLSNITCPGTHDSCARSSIPFVRTQYLSITKQLEAGLRFFDLRCRAHSDGLYMYHGGVPINLPIYLKLDEIMNEVRYPHISYLLVYSVQYPSLRA